MGLWNDDGSIVNGKEDGDRYSGSSFVRLRNNGMG